ncbi:hypothetical protein ACFSQQ_39770 [Mesorhizobium kowhaii]|uniref:hypothetical protein n=1 Tax=Mesorhizobium kowhaii TaxID=1300272 RepID=UPI0035E88CF1
MSVTAHPCTRRTALRFGGDEDAGIRLPTTPDRPSLLNPSPDHCQHAVLHLNDAAAPASGMAARRVKTPSQRQHRQQSGPKGGAQIVPATPLSRTHRRGTIQRQARPDNWLGTQAIPGAQLRFRQCSRDCVAGATIAG